MVSFDGFLATELDPLTRYAQVLCGNREDAHDLLADTLVAAHQRWERIGAMEFPLAYVRTMVTSRHLDAHRQRSRRFAIVTRFAQPPPPTPASTAVDDRSHLKDLLAHLPARQRAAVVLRYYLDLPDQVVADELGITASSVRSLTSRAMTVLRGHADLDRTGDPHAR